MKRPILLVSLTAIALLLAGYQALGKKDSGETLSLTEKLPADIHPDTLSRMPRATKDEFTTDGDKAAYDRLYGSYTKLQVSKWLGPTGTRIHLPQLAETYQTQLRLLHMGGLEPQYYELAISVAVREDGNKEEWLNHAPDRMKLLGPKVEGILKNNLPATGLDEKEVALIQFGRELFRDPKVSSKTFADMEKAFGRTATLQATLIMCYYEGNELLMKAYDQHMDTGPACSSQMLHDQGGYHTGCLNDKNIHDAW